MSSELASSNRDESSRNVSENWPQIRPADRGRLIERPKLLNWLIVVMVVGWYAAAMQMVAKPILDEGVVRAGGNSGFASDHAYRLFLWGALLIMSLAAPWLMALVLRLVIRVVANQRTSFFRSISAVCFGLVPFIVVVVIIQVVTGASPYLLPGWRWINLAVLTVLGTLISVRYLRHEIGSIGRQVALFAILFSLNVLFMVPTIGL